MAAAAAATAAEASANAAVAVSGAAGGSCTCHDFFTRGAPLPFADEATVPFVLRELNGRLDPATGADVAAAGVALLLLPAVEAAPLEGAEDVDMALLLLDATDVGGSMADAAARGRLLPTPPTGSGAASRELDFDTVVAAAAAAEGTPSPNSSSVKVNAEDEEEVEEEEESCCTAVYASLEVDRAAAAAPGAADDGAFPALLLSSPLLRHTAASHPHSSSQPLVPFRHPHEFVPHAPLLRHLQRVGGAGTANSSTGAAVSVPSAVDAAEQSCGGGGIELPLAMPSSNALLSRNAAAVVVVDEAIAPRLRFGAASTPPAASVVTAAAATEEEEASVSVVGSSATSSKDGDAF